MSDTTRNEIIQMGVDKVFKKQAEEHLIDAYASVFQKTDRILLGRQVNVKLVHGQEQYQNTAGFTDGETIYLNIDQVRPAFTAQFVHGRRSGMAKVLGVNYHELAHCLFTPRMKDPIVTDVRKSIQQYDDDLIWWAFNALEDQRAEMLFWATYGPSEVFFKASTLEYVIKHDATAKFGFPLLHGRLYLPSDIRDMSAKAWEENGGNVDKVAAIIDEYRHLVFPANSSKAKKLVLEFWNELRQMAGPKWDQQMPVSGHGSKPEWRPKDDDDAPTNSMDRGQASSKTQGDAQENLEDLEEWLEDMEAWADEYDDDEDEDGDIESDDSASTSSGNAWDDDDEDDDYDTVTSGGRGDEEGDEPSPSPSGDQSSGDQSGSPSSSSDKSSDDITSAAERALEDALEDDDLRQAVEDAVDSIDAAMSASSGSASGPRTMAKPIPVETGDRSTARKVRHAIQRLRIDLEPVWNRGHASGKLNMNRTVQAVATAQDDPNVWETVFDQWREGMEDAASIGAVVLLDQSISMRDHMRTPDGGWSSESLIQAASRALWVLRESFDKLDIPVTVYGFSDSHSVLFTPNDRVRRDEYMLFDVINGTNPNSALDDAIKVFYRMKEKHKMLFIISDGVFNSTPETQLKALQKMGVMRTLVGIGDLATQGPYGFNEERRAEMEKVFDYMEFLTDVGDFPKLVQKMVESIMSEALRWATV